MPALNGRPMSDKRPYECTWFLRSSVYGQTPSEGFPQIYPNRPEDGQQSATRKTRMSPRRAVSRFQQATLQGAYFHHAVRRLSGLMPVSMGGFDVAKGE